MPVINVGRVLNLTAPVGGVIVGNPYVINNTFVVAAQTKNAGETFVGYFRDIVVILPYYQGTVYKSQTAHWYQATSKATDYEGDHIGIFMGDYTPADTTCQVLLLGEGFDVPLRAVTPLGPGSLPDEVLVSMGGGNGTATYTVPAYAEAFEIELTTNGTWNVNGTITVTITRAGTLVADVWASKARGLPPRIARESDVVPTANTLTLKLVNTSTGNVSSGSRITRSLIWKVGQREV